MKTSDLETNRVLATPAARRKAQELAIALGDVRAAAPIRLRDVLEHAGNSAGREPAEAPHRSSTTRPASPIRRLTADRAVASLRESAQLTQTFEVDMTSVAALRDKFAADFERREGVALTFLPFVAKAAVEALALHPNINAAIDSAHTAITYHEAVSLGIAVDTPHGLLSPVIPDAGDLSLADLARSISELADGARSGTLTADRMRGGTFTVTDIGSHGALFDTPILVEGQAAMLGFGAVVRRPVVMTDSYGLESIGIRSMCYLPMTYDHRLVDGADAGRFLTTVKSRLESGLFHTEVGLDAP